MSARLDRVGLAIFAALALSGCAKVPGDFMAEPALSPVDAGLVGPAEASRDQRLGANAAPATPPLGNLYADPRVGKIGDILTVVISINDKATFGNSLDRSQTSSTGLALDFGASNGSSSSSQPATLKTDSSSSSTAQGQGAIDRSEQIQVSVPAVVAKVLADGNLLIRGSQEIRVNYELRRLTVAGIVRPSDIGKNNTIAYDRIAEARISYGGSGRLSDVQQPSWGHQLYDALNPF